MKQLCAGREEFAVRFLISKAVPIPYSWKWKSRTESRTANSPYGVAPYHRKRPLGGCDNRCTTGSTSKVVPLTQVAPPFSVSGNVELAETTQAEYFWSLPSLAGWSTRRYIPLDTLIKEMLEPWNNYTAVNGAATDYNNPRSIHSTSAKSKKRLRKFATDFPPPSLDVRPERAERTGRLADYSGTIADDYSEQMSLHEEYFPREPASQHEGPVEGRYQCHHCNNTYSDKRGLKRHLDKIGGKYYQCEICLKTFARNDVYKRHVRLVHGRFHFTH
ncbi:Zinc finger protein [Plakobranchus ocellatus]|uniref:Zinc finger protein n=1 Tax=Plakobranchus ocellatus TaxID=259542 RepID=A0AAV4AQH3_9GAST|nr:Zinc finger protein [Plakobranchus ocellatus]